MIVFLDTGILGLVSSPNDKVEVQECQEWFYGLLARSAYVLTSDLCDYEVRRGLMLASMTRLNEQGLNNLDDLQQVIDFLPVTKILLRKAARIWAESRRHGLSTADPKTLDADSIIMAQCQMLQESYPGRQVVIATTNVKHLSRFAEAKSWREIRS